MHHNDHSETTKQVFKEFIKHFILHNSVDLFHLQLGGREAEMLFAFNSKKEQRRCRQMFYLHHVQNNDWMEKEKRKNAYSLSGKVVNRLCPLHVPEIMGAVSSQRVNLFLKPKGWFEVKQKKIFCSETKISAYC